MIQFSDIYRGKRVLVTGHTGFKGSWLTCWLEQLGATVYGLALDPEGQPNHWQLLHHNVVDIRGDIRNSEFVQQVFVQAQPDIVFHLAAQPLVRRSYDAPLDTWSANLMGTANVLEASRHTKSLKAAVLITTDKVYKNQESLKGYRESDSLGGHDPYSASKAACELLVDSYRLSFGQPQSPLLIATARAGNVIGGGDWAESRLIPDLVKAATSNDQLLIRSPHATRPWQHVLECLSGYLLLGEQLLVGNTQAAQAWNFGPSAVDNRSVQEVLASLQKYWPVLSWQQSEGPHPHEAGLLYLDCTKAQTELNWQPVWSLDEALKMTSHWYQHFYTTGQADTQAQLKHYLACAQKNKCTWINS